LEIAGNEWAINQVLGLKPSLKSIDLSNKNLNNVPEKLFEIESLEEINISRNKIKHIPDGFLQMSNLKKLNFAGNHYELRQFYENLQNKLKLNEKGVKVQIIAFDPHPDDEYEYDNPEEDLDYFGMYRFADLINLGKMDNFDLRKDGSIYAHYVMDEEDIHHISIETNDYDNWIWQINLKIKEHAILDGNDEKNRALVDKYLNKKYCKYDQEKNDATCEMKTTADILSDDVPMDYWWNWSFESFSFDQLSDDFKNIISDERKKFNFDQFTRALEERE
jgi:Leucine-rich repeat (LRR) protein